MNNKEFDNNSGKIKDDKEVIELVVDNGEKSSFGIWGIINFSISILLAIALGIVYFMMQNELENIKTQQANVGINEKRISQTDAKIAMNETKYDELYNENKKQIESLIASNKELQSQLETLFANQNNFIQEPDVEISVENENDNEYYKIVKPKVPENIPVNQVIPEIPAQPALP